MSSARHASSRARGLEWSSSARDQAVERSSASSRAFECEGSRATYMYMYVYRARRRARNPEACGTLLLEYILNYLC